MIAEDRKDGGRMLGVTEAAAALGVSAKTLRKWADAGIVNAARLPGRGDRRFTTDELDRVRKDVLGIQG